MWKVFVHDMVHQGAAFKTDSANSDCKTQIIHTLGDNFVAGAFISLLCVLRAYLGRQARVGPCPRVDLGPVERHLARASCRVQKVQKQV
jgi:hypothetical protein